MNRPKNFNRQANGFAHQKLRSLGAILCLGCLVSVTFAAKPAKTAAEEDKYNARFPTGCSEVGFEQNLKVLTLKPGKEGALQSMYFLFNQTNQPVTLYHMRDEDSEFSTRFTHSIYGRQWGVLATGEQEIKFMCALGDGKSYGKIIDCADAFKVCEYVNVKFGLNNKGNFWIVGSTTRNGAVSGVVHYGIIPGV